MILIILLPYETIARDDVPNCDDKEGVPLPLHSSVSSNLTMSYVIFKLDTIMNYRSFD